MGYDSNRVQQIGPFPFAFDTPSILTTGSRLTDLAAGTTVIRAWAELEEAWTDADPDDELQIFVGGATNWEDGKWTAMTFHLLPTNPPNADIAANVVFEMPYVDSFAKLSVAARVLEDSVLGVYLDDSNATAGAGNVYALILTPDDDVD